MLSTCDVPRQLSAVFSMEKPNLPSFGASTRRPTPTSADDPPAARYDSCDAAQVAGELPCRAAKEAAVGS